MTELTLKIDGMSCGHCVGAVTKVLKAVPGVEVDRVAIGSAVVHYDAATVSPGQIAQAVTDDGYAAVVAA